MGDGPPMLGIVGWKNSGKTTLVERLLPLLARHGLKVATVKHSHHALRPGDGTTDGERHARAGAATTIVIGAGNWEQDGIPQDGSPPDLTDMPQRLHACGLILIEGYKKAPIPKIEVRRAAAQNADAPPLDDPHIIAIVADHAVGATRLPTFAIDDVRGIAGFIAAFAVLPKADRSPDASEPGGAHSRPPAQLE